MPEKPPQTLPTTPRTSPHRYAQELDYLTGDRMAELGIPILHWKTKGTIHISLIPESGWPHPIPWYRRVGGPIQSAKKGTGLPP